MSSSSKTSDSRDFFDEYAATARPIDTSLVKDLGNDLDGLLIFSGLFSAVSTGFIVESYKLLLPDYTQLAYYAVLNATPPYTPATFVVARADRTVNGLWLSSLILSLLVALIVLLVKQWLLQYTGLPEEDRRQWVLLRQFRYDCFYQWRIPHIIATLPVIMNTSLFLFLIGLVIFLLGMDCPLAVMVLALLCALFIVYTASTLSPLVWPNSPLRSVLTPVITVLSLSAARLLRVPATAVPKSWNDDPWYAVPESMSLQCFVRAVSWLHRSRGTVMPKTPTLPFIEALDIETTRSADLPPVTVDIHWHNALSDAIFTAVDNISDHRDKESRLPLCIRVARTWLDTEALNRLLSKPEILLALRGIPISSPELLSNCIEELAQSLLVASGDAEPVSVQSLVHQYVASSGNLASSSSAPVLGPSYLESVFMDALCDTTMDVEYSTRIATAILSLWVMDPTNDCWSRLANEVSAALADGRFEHMDFSDGSFLAQVFVVLGVSLPVEPESEEGDVQ